MQFYFHDAAINKFNLKENIFDEIYLESCNKNRSNNSIEKIEIPCLDMSWNFHFLKLESLQVNLIKNDNFRRISFYFRRERRKNLRMDV